MDNPDWLSISIPVAGIDTEILVAWLDQCQVDTIVEHDNYFEAFVTSDKLEDVLSMLSQKYSLSKDDLEIIKQENKNWNQEWESNFDPVIVDNIMIRACFHEAPGNDMIDILIQPKMAFGTGHHETTFQMMQKINMMDLEGKRILDYGCGTGILGILALKKKIDHLDAIDIQEEAVENTVENFELNNLDPDQYSVVKGDIELVEQKSYDMIFANINRHVLESKARVLAGMLKLDGDLLISGILSTDFDLICGLYREAGLDLFSKSQKGEWLCLHFKNS